MAATERRSNPRTSPRTVLWTAAMFALALWGGLGASPWAAAAPHTISREDHPFDPDWPDVYLILMNKCAACHLPNSDQSDLTSYQALIDGKNEDGEPLIVPGNALDSVLYDYVVWNAEAKRDSTAPDSPMMPEDKHEWLTAGQLALLKRWIERGALEYKLPDGCSIRPLLEIDFPSARQCKACHPKQYTEWARSMHAYAQHSPINEAFNLTLQERTSGTIGTFCTRCHTPIGTALGENGSRRNVHRSQISMEGITCVVCHKMQGHRYKSSARLMPVPTEPGKFLDQCMFGPFDDAVSAEVGAHQSAGSSYLKSGAFCGTCHDVTSPEGVRLEEAFSEWKNSPAAAKGISCRHCHMGPIQGVPIPESHRPLGRAAQVPGVDPEKIPLRHLSDHTFAGPDYSLLPDTEFPHKLDWMYEIDYRDPTRLTPYQQKTLRELRKKNRKQLEIASQKRYELLRNGARISVQAPEAARCGGHFDIRVNVHSTLPGHSYPTGFTAERQLWVSVSLIDPVGRVVFQSGHLDHNGDLLDDHSHDVIAGKAKRDKHLLNFQSKFIALTTVGTERSVVVSVNRHLEPINILRPATGLSASFGRPPVFRVAKGSLPPLKTMGQKYPIHIPKQPGDYLLDVRLNYRHLPPTLLDHIGTPHLKHLLEIVVIDHHQQVIQVHP